MMRYKHKLKILGRAVVVFYTYLCANKIIWNYNTRVRLVVNGLSRVNKIIFSATNKANPQNIFTFNDNDEFKLSLSWV